MNAEMRDMVCVYAQESFNERAAKERYLDLYPNRKQPDFKIFKNIYDRIGEMVLFVQKKMPYVREKFNYLQNGDFYGL